LALAVAVAFAAAHVFGCGMVVLQTTPRSAWLSFAGGVSAAYVFVHLLPELAEHQEAFQHEAEQEGGVLQHLERHTYLIALAGLAAFYGLDRLARLSARREERAGRERQPTRGTFWLHLGSFAVCNVLIGYLLLHREDAGLRGLLIYAVAMGLHFVVNDQGLREHHGALYDRQGRWILAAAPLVGFGLGLAAVLPDLAIAALFAFLAGGVVLNVLKEELPEERESRFSAFAFGTALSAGLLLATS
jgi:zinc transporter ZupT